MLSDDRDKALDQIQGAIDALGFAWDEIEGDGRKPLCFQLARKHVDASRAHQIRAQQLLIRLSEGAPDEDAGDAPRDPCIVI